MDVVCEPSHSRPSTMGRGSRLGPWHGQVGPTGPGDGPAGGAPARGGLSMEIEGRQEGVSHGGGVSDLVARDFVCGNYISELRILELEDERVTPVYLISLLGSGSHYERSG
ncbi:voltage-gated Ca2+ channel, alpha subunit [Dorcoceras hygrometricum]|uniref:Voltage-gated Ca2+ channel, alpha subunit n=1 Tax=Dorcoceras hygrometricum TaxID=472368 RepID=A0A2Z7CUE5_9LAMI|nr:voltage-gated Ca2+ channel, alpha subunit [Dorcoceras hygrometricum]